MDAELAAAATMLERIDPNDLQAHRETLRRLHESQKDRWQSNLVSIQELGVGASDLAPPVPLRIFRPLGAGPAAAALLWFHGGAFAVGFAAIDDDFCARIAAAAGYVVVSPEYRLAPEHPFPAGFDDCLRTYQWLVGAPDILGIDPRCIVVGGASAGAGLAASLCLRLRDGGGPPPVLQLLACPVVDDRLQTRSMQEFESTPVFDCHQAKLMWSRYLAGGQGETSPYAAPGRAGDLSSLPSAYVQTAQFDPLRDEGLDYARRLVEAGNAVELHHFPDTFHSFDMVVPTAAISRRAFTDYVAVLQKVALRSEGPSPVPRD